MNERGIAYRITGPDGTEAVLDDEQDAAYVGNVTEITGLADTPEVRYRGREFADRHGGTSRPSKFAVRNVIFEGDISTNPVSAQNERIARLRRAVKGMDAPVTVEWRETGQPPKMLRGKLAEALRIKTGFPRTYYVAIVCDDPRIYSQSVTTRSIDGTQDSLLRIRRLINQGDDGTPQAIRVEGPITDPAVHVRDGDGVLIGSIVTSGLTVPEGQWLDLDVYAHRATLNGVANVYDKVDFAASTWPWLPPGVCSVQLAGGGTSGATKLTVTFRSAWL